MKLLEFLANDEWDAPFFKRLARNDTGEARGHQGGMVLPKDLRKFLPILDEATISPSAPTTDRYLRSEMFVGTNHLTDGTIRYQFQTWGGTRSAESRITDGFAPLGDRASEGDLLLFQRRADTLDRFRLILVKHGTRDYNEIRSRVNDRHWGTLSIGDVPVTKRELAEAETEVERLVESPFAIMRSEILRAETRQLRIARSAVFRERVRNEYQRQCSVSGIIIVTPTLLHEVEAAHVVPVSEGGTDDIRNGLALTHTLHWAFDHGLFGVLPDRTVFIPRKVKATAGNDFLRQFEKKSIRDAKTASLRVHLDALEWHMENRVKQWE